MSLLGTRDLAALELLLVEQDEEGLRCESLHGPSPDNWYCSKKVTHRIRSRHTNGFAMVCDAHAQWAIRLLERNPRCAHCRVRIRECWTGPFPV